MPILHNHLSQNLKSKQKTNALIFMTFFTLMKRIIKALKMINYRLWVAILTTMFLPIVYQTVRYSSLEISQVIGALILQANYLG